MTITGGCLCGAVRYSADELRGGGHCHCVSCRRSSGTGHCTHAIVPEAGFRLRGAVRFYDEPADSGNVISRGFCPTCGAPIYSRNSGMPGVAFVRASSLDDPEAFVPQMIVYADSAPSWDRIEGELPSFAGMPPQMPDVGG